MPYFHKREEQVEISPGASVLNSIVETSPLPSWLLAHTLTSYEASELSSLIPNVL